MNLKSCDICPRNCQVNRLNDERGFCRAGKDIYYYSAFLHQGEEPAISGTCGSGTIFFSGCNLQCLYCQNHKFSTSLTGKRVSPQELASIMLSLQSQKAHNINLVTPTHFLPQILESLEIASLDIPIVYNTSGYEKKSIIEELAGIVDVYLSDFKYIDKAGAQKYSHAPDYPKACQESLLIMHGQVKPLWEENLLKKGLIVRHLVMPGRVEESKKTLNWLNENLPDALASVMFQYQPYYKANNFPEINRAINKNEYNQIKSFSEEIGLKGWVQALAPREELAGVHFKEEK